MGEALDVGAVVVGLAGGLALFLYGMDKMTGSLKVVAGARLKGAMARLTNGRFRAAATGAMVTGVLQSSSVTTVLVVGFVSAGLLSLAGAIGVIMGANVGTTITAQIIAFKVTKYALVLVAGGTAFAFMGRTGKARHYGHMVLGLGLVFYGMEVMSLATHPMRSWQPFIDTMARMDNPALAILAAAAFTGIVQSSSATTGVIIVLAAQGFITLEAGIYLVLGANIGTCVTALLASTGKSREAVRAATVHVLFNVLGVLLWVFIVDQLAVMVRWLSPAAGHLAGQERMAAEVPRQIANAHTVFNVANTLVFIWFTAPLARLVTRLVPDRPETADGVRPKYLDDILLDTPALALDRVRMELRRLGERALDMVKGSLQVTLDGDEDELEALASRDNEVDSLHAAIIGYLGRLSKQGLEEQHSVALSTYMAAANQMENIGDMVETNLVDVGRARIRGSLAVSEETREQLQSLHEGVTAALELALEALDARDADMAKRVVNMKSSLNASLHAIEVHLGERLVASGSDRVKLFKLESEIVEYLRRVYYFAKRIAKGVVVNNGR